jgi:serine protease Do
LLAQAQEKSAPAKALEAYLRLARNDNCVAQLRLAQAYASGVLVKKNLTQAYFWLLLAKVNAFVRKADVSFNDTAGMSYEAGYQKQCGMAAFPFTLRVQIEARKILPAKLVQAAQDAATTWTKGATERLLPAPEVTATREMRPSVKSNESPKTATITSPSGSKSPAPPPERRPEEHGRSEDYAPAQRPAAALDLARPNPVPGSAVWTATWTQLSEDARPPQLRSKQSAEELFSKARSSVWVVVAATSMSQSAATLSQGSAVAITRSRLLTNYHVVEGQRFVFVKQGDHVFEATVIASDKEGDRCVLAVKEDSLNPVDGLRGFTGLRVGEQVYTIGSPSALESTLGQGIVSGLRTVAGQHLIQTTAPISPGSSGGGLFDSAGNLVGITSFTLKNSQGLNFAIAAEDYFH